MHLDLRNHSVHDDQFDGNKGEHKRSNSDLTPVILHF